MRQEEEIYKGLTNLNPAIDDKDDMVNLQSSYTHPKHRMCKVIMGMRRQGKKREIIVAKEDSEKVLQFIQELGHQKETKREEEDKGYRF